MERNFIHFIDGPAAGSKLVLPGPLGNLPSAMIIPVFEDGSIRDSGKKVTSAAVYQRTSVGFLLERLDDSANAIQKATEQISEKRARSAAQTFYEAPDYSTYSKHPELVHTQVLITAGKRKAHVDDLIAPLVKEVWRLNMDTVGSCQERPPTADGLGKAYIGFAVRSDAKQFHSVLEQYGFEASYHDKDMRIRAIGTEVEVVINAGNVHFNPADIGSITSVLRSL